MILQFASRSILFTPSCCGIRSKNFDRRNKKILYNVLKSCHNLTSLTSDQHYIQTQTYNVNRIENLKKEKKRKKLHEVIK